ncbi:MAG: UDP-N-acetylmuramate--L-alanine ligase [Candidatus Moranbacteria bacterium]|nr:UDP-N-acetylmuramate--L-alanine ligase [Candidatus Moranbacteria bacterium]MDD3965001.1 UDP-N-acetylmuramate--L-alanine ligase [Candidatus Moranbacteria bacterium]
MTERLSHFRKIHMIGIKGAGMTALAELLTKQGIIVTGSDTSEVFFTDALLQKWQIQYAEQFDAKNIPSNVEAVIYSTAYSKEKNSELAFAFTLGVPVLSYPQALGMLTREKMTLAVCGTHGKTTTSALLAETLKMTGSDPSAIVGSRILNWEGNALAGSGEFLVLEADEYQNKLAEYTPFCVILTSVDFDHPDFFATKEQYEQVFKDFVARIPKHGVLVYCNDLSSVVNVAEVATCQKISYGFLPGADFHIDQFTPAQMGFVFEKNMPKQTFTVTTKNQSLGQFSLQLAGAHNTENAVAVLALCSYLKQDIERIRRAFEKFSGTERRFEYIGERYGTLLYDDYAHHPEEIIVTLRAFRELYPKRRLRVVFHPHTFTRTKALLAEFSQSFDSADEVYILDIYGSAREEQGGVSSLELVSRINQFVPGKATYVPSQEAVIEHLEETMGRQDVIITLGAGNVWEISHHLARVGDK